MAWARKGRNDALSSVPNLWGDRMDKILRRSPIHLLHRAKQCAADIFDAEVGDLSPRQLVALIAISENEGKSQTALVERTGVDRSTLSLLVGRLHDEGLVNRRRTRADARAYSVRLTPAGRRALQKAEPLAKRVDETLLQALPDKRRTQFLEALQSVVVTLEKVER
jgi:MarR family transcriptional regulator, temperature-dependent positive regulator of motility